MKSEPGGAYNQVFNFGAPQTKDPVFKAFEPNWWTAFLIMWYPTHGTTGSSKPAEVLSWLTLSLHCLHPMFLWAIPHTQVYIVLATQ